MSTPATAPAAPEAPKSAGMRKNGMSLQPNSPRPHSTQLIQSFSGKNWHDSSKKPFRPNSGLTSYAKRKEAADQAKAVKELEREMKDEKEAERQVGTHCFSQLSLSLFLSFSFLKP
jgi:hypothetical protein